MAARGRVLPIGDSPEAVVLCRVSFRALQSRQLSGERDVRSGSTAGLRRRKFADFLRTMPGAVLLKMQISLCAEAV